ncbi:hypothetical protein [Aquimarina aggregata]|uniref:hypothetical protein n=1 Tax=Aquimarina aggregata TaxID=1642818 RepID=UPI002490F5B2|nr:hypothetical protein [Aquimarina aggregata]
MCIKIDENLIKEHIQNALIKDCMKIRDHRNNVLILDQGVFSFNGHKQPKTVKSIEVIFMDAFKLTRHITLNNVEYLRKGSKWYQKE